ncbi:preprotein translocase subunit SecG [Wolbachia endosymbiont of Litomosoides sigmodontis]|uniref:preprotein translocase subunit SecG n=2 Tax=Wolbachia endosymbiont of Litomosoides sigmodontis TaxID=80850 RepID=UPI00158A19BA|nr:preprotein translocase subunit SecG [Wolbachia endosymbiont of Litomosoides sigmodontis]QKX03005.1 preprotein translocase subunit SecG [Wolbachia endosymbiont of Litomosoides sigmodontis]
MSITILSVFQIVLVVMLVILVLLRPPGSSSLSGFSSSQQGLNSIMPIKASADPLSGITAIVVGLFIMNTLLLSGLCSKDVHKKSIAEKIILEKQQKNESTSVPFEN